MNTLSPLVRETVATQGPAGVLALARARRGPIVEPAGVAGYPVTFVFFDRDRAVRAAAVVCPAVPAGVARLAALGDGVFAATFALPAAARVRYHYRPDPPADLRTDAPGARRIDHLNPSLDQVRLTGLRTRLLESVLTLPGAPEPPALPPPSGTLETLTIDSAALRHPKEVVLHRPAGGPHPVVLLLESNDEWRGGRVFDALAASGRCAPFVGVLVGGGRQLTARLRDLNGGPALARFVADEVWPLVADRCAVRAGGHVAAGFSAGGLAAAALCLDDPTRFSRLLALSAALHLTPRMNVLRPGTEVSTVVTRYAAADRLPSHAYLAAGSYEDSRVCARTRELAAVLHHRGVAVRFDTGPTDHDTLSARAYLADGLGWLLTR